MKKYICFIILLLATLTGSAGAAMKLEAQEILVPNKPIALAVGQDGMLYVTAGKHGLSFKSPWDIVFGRGAVTICMFSLTQRFRRSS